MGMNPVRSIARPLLAAIFFEGGVAALRSPAPRAAMAKPVISKISNISPSIPDDEETVVRINAAVQVGAAMMLASGRFPRLAAAVLAGSLVPTTVAGHAFWKADADTKPMQRLQFAKNLSILGGLLLAVADTSGKPSVSWRLSHLSKPNFVPDLPSISKPDFLDR